ncbi:hypothetical protein [Endozoicomonas numazuensis]|nr:hypothetical protein [Endozoicomonas numazuensis]
MKPIAVWIIVFLLPGSGSVIASGASYRVIEPQSAVKILKRAEADRQRVWGKKRQLWVVESLIHWFEQFPGNPMPDEIQSYLDQGYTLVAANVSFVTTTGGAYVSVKEVIDRDGRLTVVLIRPRSTCQIVNRQFTSVPFAMLLEANGKPVDVAMESLPIDCLTKP